MGCLLIPRAALGAVEEEKILCAYPRNAMELVFLLKYET
jgi:hypothetical protein